MRRDGLKGSINPKKKKKIIMVNFRYILIYHTFLKGKLSRSNNEFYQSFQTTLEYLFNYHSFIVFPRTFGQPQKKKPKNNLFEVPTEFESVYKLQKAYAAEMC